MATQLNGQTLLKAQIQMRKGVHTKDRDRERAQGLPRPRVDSCGNGEERKFALRSMSVKLAVHEFYCNPRI